MSLKNPCKECPWAHKINESWQNYLREKIDENKHDLISLEHACHMITKESFDRTSYGISIPPIENLCIGSIIAEKNRLSQNIIK